MSKKNISKSFTKIGQATKEAVDTISSTIDSSKKIAADAAKTFAQFDFEKMAQNLSGNFNSLNSPNVSNGVSINIELFSKVFTNHFNLMNQNFDENMKIIQNFVKCKDAKDCMNLQQDLYKQNFASIMDMIINANSMLHSIYSGKLNSVVRDPKEN